MNIRVTQCEVGKFNLCSSESSFSFYMSIYDGNSVVVRDGVKAQLHYSGEPDDIGYFDNPIENLPDVLERCIKYAGRVWSSTDYFAQCIVFARVYQEHFEEITAAYVEKRDRALSMEIERMQKEMADKSPLSPYVYETANECLQDEIGKQQKWMDQSKAELEQIKEGTEKYAEASKKIENYQKKIEKLTAQIIPQTIEND